MKDTQEAQKKLRNIEREIADLRGRLAILEKEREVLRRNVTKLDKYESGALNEVIIEW